MTRVRTGSLALAAAVVLIWLPAPSGATNLATLNLSSSGYRPTSPSGDAAQLSLSSDETGTGRLRGRLVLGGERLIAEANEDAHSRWTDLDGDGVAGVTYIAGTFSRAHAGPVAVVITAERDIDQPGAYQVDITVDERTSRLDVRAAIAQRQG